MTSRAKIYHFRAGATVYPMELTVRARSKCEAFDLAKRTPDHRWKCHVLPIDVDNHDLIAVEPDTDARFADIDYASPPVDLDDPEK